MLLIFTVTQINVIQFSSYNFIIIFHSIPYSLSTLPYYSTVNSQLSGIQASGILIQPAKISKKIYHLYLFKNKFFQVHTFTLPAATSSCNHCLPSVQARTDRITVHVSNIIHPSICYVLQENSEPNQKCTVLFLYWISVKVCLMQPAHTIPHTCQIMRSSLYQEGIKLLDTHLICLEPRMICLSAMC